MANNSDNINRELGPDEVDISGLRPEEVLTALYNAIDLRNLGIYWRMSVKEAKKLSDQFDYLRNKVMKVAIKDNHILNTWEFDGYNGWGAAKRAIEYLKIKKEANKKSEPPEKHEKEISTSTLSSKKDHKTRLSRNDTLMDVIMKMSEGHPVAMTCIVEMLESEDWSNNVPGMTGFTQVHCCDLIGIYGFQLSVLWEYCCKRDIKELDKVLQNWKCGRLSREEIIENVSQVRAPFIDLLPIKKLCKPSPKTAFANIAEMVYYGVSNNKKTKEI